MATIKYHLSGGVADQSSNPLCAFDEDDEDVVLTVAVSTKLPNSESTSPGIAPLQLPGITPSYFSSPRRSDIKKIMLLFCLSICYHTNRSCSPSTFS